MSRTPLLAWARPASRLLMLGLVSVLLVLLVSPDASAATPKLRQRSLAVTVVDGAFRATTKVSASKNVRVDKLGVCVRSAGNEAVEVASRAHVRLGKKAKKFTFAGQITVPAGRYQAATCARVKGAWTKVGAWQSVTVPAQPATPGASTSTGTSPTGQADQDQTTQNQTAQNQTAQTSPSKPAAPAVPAALSGAWSLGLDQGFTGGQLDRSTWQPSRWGGDDDQTPFNPDLEDAQFSSKNVSVTDDGLSLRTTRVDTTAGGRSYRYRSGTVSTQGTFALREGSYVQAQIRIPKGDGLWPAFWAVPTGEWPPEVDIFEFFDTKTDTRPFFNYHYADASGVAQQTGPRAYGVPGVDYRSGWHTYGLQRTGGRLVPWLDGVPYPDVSTPGPGNTPLFLILNLSVKRGSNAPAGASMDVRNVRAWSLG